MTDKTAVIDQIESLFNNPGSDWYMGEPVTIAEHMLQSAWCAEQGGADPSLIAAALLHDIGHLTVGSDEFCLENGNDNFHETAGARFLEQWFPQSVCDPVRLHVDAKRYLCAGDPDYMERLSEASRHSLAVQGGPMAPREAREFESTTKHLDSVVAVRRFDDSGKTAAANVPGFSHYRPLLESLL